MKKHASFYRGIAVGIALVAILDLSIVHLVLEAHRSFSHPSVEIVEPIVIIVALVTFIYLARIEYKRKTKGV